MPKLALCLRQYTRPKIVSRRIIMTAEVLSTVREGRVLRLTLARPEKRNALDLTLCRALVTSIEDAVRDPLVGAILLTGEGKAFCAGMDLADIEPGGDSAEMDAVHEQIFTQIGRASG